MRSYQVVMAAGPGQHETKPSLNGPVPSIPLIANHLRSGFHLPAVQPICKCLDLPAPYLHRLLFKETHQTWARTHHRTRASQAPSKQQCHELRQRSQSHPMLLHRLAPKRLTMRCPRLSDYQLRLLPMCDRIRADQLQNSPASPHPRFSSTSYTQNKDQVSC